MSLPENNGPAPAAAPQPRTQRTQVLEHNPHVSETGDLAASMNLYGDSAETPAVIDSNDPNDAFDEPTGLEESDGGADEQGEAEEGASDEEEAGEVGGEEEADSEEEGDSSEEEGEDDSGEAGESAKPTKTAKVNIGDKEYDVPLDATVPTPVNGEMQTPTIQELRDAYSSKANIHRELQQVATAKTELDAHRRQMIRKLDKKEAENIEREYKNSRAQQALAAGNFEEAINELFEFDADKWDRFDELMMGYYPEFAGLDPNARRAIQLDRRNKMHEKKAARATEATAMQREIDAFDNYKKQRCETAGVTEDEVEDAWDDLVVRANKGEFTKEQIERLNNATAHQRFDTAVAEALASKTRKKITEVLKSKFSKLASKSADIIKEMEEKLSPKFLVKATKEEIAGIIARDYNGGKVGKQTTGKVASTNSLRDKAQPRHTLREAATQDDDDLYDQGGRNEPGNQVWGAQFTR